MERLRVGNLSIIPRKGNCLNPFVAYCVLHITEMIQEVLPHDLASCK